MLRIGSHLSTTKGFLNMGRVATQIGANTFQFFTRNPRGGNAKALDPADVAAYLAFAGENDMGPILGHASYTLNPAADARLAIFVRDTMADDLDRMEHFPGSLYNFHPGSRGGRSEEDALQAVAATLNDVLPEHGSTVVLLETMTGKTTIGQTFEELRAIIDGVKHNHRLGVCLDTCHVFNAGYDIVGDLDGVVEQFDKAIGLERLRAVHLNDSKNPLGSRMDRHEVIGGGKIGMDAFARLINHPAFRDLPFYLETPNDLDGYAKEIAELKERSKEKKPTITPKKTADKKAGTKKVASGKATGKK